MTDGKMKINFNTSKGETLYIEMCEKAKQLQEMWKPRIGDACIDMGDLWYITDQRRLRYVASVKDKDTWLPTEENIQAILYAPTMEKPIGLLNRFTEWTNGHRGITDGHMSFPIKHLWLCYLMYHLYGMTWVNNNWQKIEYN